jgi:paraquat-inducible protein A
MTAAITSALDRGLALCHTCGLVAPITTHAHVNCRRCGSSVHARKRNSLQRTWGYLIAAVLLYIPANVLPIMLTSSLAGNEAHTILGGVGQLWQSGSWALALIVFVASVMVPVLKMLALALLAYGAQHGAAHKRQRAKLYRMVEFVGQWSMLDVFVVVLLVALVHFGSLVQIEPGTGAIAFCAVVVLTMLSSLSFDPRLTWDIHGRE